MYRAGGAEIGKGSHCNGSCLLLPWGKGVNMGPDIFDLVIVVTLVLATINGAMRGFVGGIVGILSIILGFWAARSWNGQVAPLLTFISDPSLRSITACVLIFIAVMLAMGILARILKKIIAFSFITWLDRFAGALLGLAKGIIIWALILIVLEKLFHDSAFLRESRALPYFHALMQWISQWLPPDIARHIGV